MVRALLVLIFLAGLAAGGGWAHINNKVEQTLPIAQSFYTIKSGTSFSHLINDFKRNGWIDSSVEYKIYGKLNPEQTKLKAGTYQLTADMNFIALLALFNAGVEHQFKITFVEGSTFKEWLVQLAETDNIKNTLADKSAKQILALLNSEYTHPEGIFFPDTYKFTAGTSDLDILRQAHKRMVKELEQVWQERDKGLPYKSSYDVLIMASLIEKETGQVFEQPMIASVFINRLAKKMRLQTDPTIIYGLGDRYTGDITYANIREKTAYNTYQINGMPPTPIAMPGLSALKASVHPDKTSLLYFVSKGNGEHHFSKTLREHNNAVNKYIRGK
ncbi:endolytic transglycosylase MltG [Thalassomonas sp. M1454]|uniref:endolytic transglycosylase MltG n=1 Tax=Thalassomonas sp. M1454 TaxID=2594477 RepID=UPI00117DBBC2|nr:endolytic transglycosylase MltG [Thalassomonas sp. M1454]TRX56649.1 endolytic transglycosylase MltG [Thalassomonas sp. M1454]